MSNHLDYKILVVDCNEGFRARLRGELRDHGYRVEVASNGLLGLELQIAEPRQLIFSTVSMPIMGGFPLLRAVRHLNPNIPVILYTSFPKFSKFFPEHVKRPNQFYEKPFDMGEMLACVDNLLGFPVEPCH